MMRVWFVLSVIGCLITATAPMTSVASDARVASELVSASALVAGPTAQPTEVTLVSTPVPTLAPPTPAPTKRPAPPPILKPKGAVRPVPTPAPVTPSPAPRATATPKATSAPTPKATPKPTQPPASSAPATYSRQQVIDGIEAGWGGNDAKAVEVADCESSLNPRATSPGGTYLGLWQFHIETWRAYGGSGDPRDHSPQTQTQVAWAIFQDHRWGAWPGCA